jgi:hypothetical protein
MCLPVGCRGEKNMDSLILPQPLQPQQLAPPKLLLIIFPTPVLLPIALLPILLISSARVSAEILDKISTFMKMV